MAQLNVSLPDGLKEWVDDCVALGEYSSPSDFVRDLIRRHKQRKQDLDQLQREIDMGLASGVDPRPVEQIFSDLRSKYLGERD